MSKSCIVQAPAAGCVDFVRRAVLSRHFIENSVDPVTGQPYFSVFYGHPLELWHDWPDFGDLTARYWEACHMIREMTGVAPHNTNTLGDMLFSYFGSDGLSYRPATLYSTNSAELFDNSRTIYALCSVYMATQEKMIKEAIVNLVRGLEMISEVEKGYRYIPGSRYSHGAWESRTIDCGYFIGPLIRPLMKAYEVTGYELARELAIDFARYVVEVSHLFGPKGEFDDHCHSRLATACGLFVCGRAAQNNDWIQIARNAWDFARAKSGPCGFVPEYLGFHAGQFRSETCAIMDYLDLTLLLASAGDDAKWSEAERVVRNHLIESQVTSTDWAPAGNASERSDLFLSDNVAERMLGGFAGWSSFDQMFGITPCYSEGWYLTEYARQLYRNRKRVFQNCCGPAGLRSLYLAWSQVMEFEEKELRVNMLFSRSIPGARMNVVDGDKNQIQVTIAVDRPCNLNMHVPDWCPYGGYSVTINGETAKTSVVSDRLMVLGINSGDQVVVTLPYEIKTVEYVVAHGAYPPEVFDITFKADSAIRINRVSGGISDGERAKASVLYDSYPLYRRSEYDVYAEESTPIVSNASIDWF
jgi:hypothetical protein